MRFHAALFALVLASCALAQQPEIVNAQLTTKASSGLTSEIDSLKQTRDAVWLGYTIATESTFDNGWGGSRVAYLEGEQRREKGSYTKASTPQDHAVILLQVAAGEVSKLRVESPERQIDAGGKRVVWMTGVALEDSVATLERLAAQTSGEGLRDSAVFAIALHRTAGAVPALVSLAASGNDLKLREKAAFWLANQRGREGFLAIQKLAREDADARFREKLTFDLTLSKDPGALDELIRMAHADASPQVRKQAQFWMATRGGREIVASLRNATNSDPNEDVRRSAVFALSRLPGPEAATQLIQIAQSSKDAEVRKQAVFWLGQSSDPQALEFLTKLLKQ